jgi:hypothetical protein
VVRLLVVGRLVVHRGLGGSPPPHPPDGRRPPGQRPPPTPRPPEATRAEGREVSFSGAPGIRFVWESVAFLKFTYK